MKTPPTSGESDFVIIIDSGMFTFKQFTIRQERVALKVCTDACVLGAFADVGANAGIAQTRILDIGTGTGLLALMAAQRNPAARVDAVEIDEVAAEQASENIANSPFGSRVRVWHERIQDFSPASRYDRILTNPPFYTNHLRPPDPALTRALHTDELPFSELLTAVLRLLKPDGQWWVLLPPYQTAQLTALAQTANLHPSRQLHLRHRADKPAFRVVTGFTFAAPETAPTLAGATNFIQETLFIRESDNQTYTSAFQALLRDFYLIF